MLKFLVASIATWDSKGTAVSGAIGLGEETALFVTLGESEQAVNNNMTHRADDNAIVLFVALIMKFSPYLFIAY
jgi:hypothetical protein